MKFFSIPKPHGLYVNLTYNWSNGYGLSCVKPFTYIIFPHFRGEDDESECILLWEGNNRTRLKLLLCLEPVT